MRFAIALTILFSAALATGHAAESEWSVFQPGNCACYVRLPSNPEYQTQMLDVTAIHIYIAKDISRSPAFIYTVAMGDYPKEKFTDKDAAKKILDADRDSFARAVNGKIVSETASPVGTYPGRMIVVSAEDGQARHLLREILVDNRIYQLTVCVPASKIDDPDLTKFFDSFQLPKK